MDKKIIKTSDKPPIIKSDQERFPDYIDISVFDIVTQPEMILRRIMLKLEKANIQCLDCYEKVTFRFAQTYWSMKCGCGINIFYPPRKDRGFAYGKRFISAEEYKPRRANP